MDNQIDLHIALAKKGANITLPYERLTFEEFSLIANLLRLGAASVIVFAERCPRSKKFHKVLKEIECEFGASDESFRFKVKVDEKRETTKVIFKLKNKGTK